MISAKTKKAMPLIFVELPRSENAIYNLKKICGLDITVEALRRKAPANQCHRCQKFGHAQKNCRVEPKCVKCSGDHFTSECNKSATTPAKCANCLGDHPASYKGCPKFPKFKFNKATNHYVKIGTKSYAQVVSTNLQKQLPQSSDPAQPATQTDPKPSTSKPVPLSIPTNVKNKNSQAKKQTTANTEGNPIKDALLLLANLITIVSSAQTTDEATQLIISRIPALIQSNNN